MKRNTKRRKWKRVASTGVFSLFQSSADVTIWEVSWRNSDGKYGRRRFSAQGIEKALSEAPAAAGLVAPLNLPPQIRTVDAFSMALSNASRGAKSKSDWNYYVDRFIDWLAKNRKTCTHWHLLTRQIVRDYLVSVFDGRSATTRRLATQPIVQTAGYMWPRVWTAERHGAVGYGLQIEGDS